MKKQVGIITFHDADNLGAVLQAYALQTTLENKCDVSAEIIDYRCDKILSTRRVSINSIKSLAKAPFLWVYYAVKHKGFAGFRKRFLKLSQKYTQKNIQACDGKYDVYISGSDQVWNPECSDFDDAYFLSFVENGVRASYAASIGNFRFSAENRGHYASLIARFSAVSAREITAVNELRRIGVQDVCVMPDPVMLLTREEWGRIASGRIIKEKYVFVYQILEDVNVLAAARAYANEHGYKLICNKTSAEFILNSSPQDFLSWMINAEAVFTNSFHGTAFSLVLGKEFASDIAQRNGKRNDRVADVLEAAGAQACIIVGAEHTPKSVDADEFMNNARVSAVEYLKRICE